MYKLILGSSFFNTAFSLVAVISLIVVFSTGSKSFASDRPVSANTLNLKKSMFIEVQPYILNESEMVPSITVYNLSSFLSEDSSETSPQMYLYVFYAKGLPAGLGNKDATLKKIKKILKYEIHEDSLTIPSIGIEKEPGISSSYDLIVLVVSPFDNFLWTNTNGSFVQYPPNVNIQGGIPVHIDLDYIRKDTIDLFLKSHEPLNSEDTNLTFYFQFGTPIFK